MYQKILVPLDGSDLAECVLPHVEAIAGGCLIKEVILTQVVVPFNQPIASEYVLKDSEVARVNSELRTAAEKSLNRAKSKIKLSGSTVRTEILHGIPAAELADYSIKNGVDLIVIATHGRSGVSRWVWGSVADRILRSACVPVLMVRAPGCVPGI
jgi:nucleotide-binding universal stress UspA family protein